MTCLQNMRLLGLAGGMCVLIMTLPGCKRDAPATPSESVPPTGADQTNTESAPAKPTDVPAKPTEPPLPSAGPIEPTAKPPADAVHAGLTTRTGQPPADAVHGNPAVSGQTLSLAGVTMTIPDGWASQPVRRSVMGPKAIFHMPDATDSAEKAVARVTHFPGMKGKDERNIERWISQVKHPQGRAMTRDDATIAVTELGEVKLTVVDISGVVDTSVDGSGAGEPDQRLIAAIVDHPKGPHFIKISGTVSAVKQWEASIDAFLKSAAIAGP